MGVVDRHWQLVVERHRHRRRSPACACKRCCPMDTFTNVTVLHAADNLLARLKVVDEASSRSHPAAKAYQVSEKSVFSIPRLLHTPLSTSRSCQPVPGREDSARKHEGSPGKTLRTTELNPGQDDGNGCKQYGSSYPEYA